jgi:hypothetical protein
MIFFGSDGPYHGISQPPDAPMTTLEVQEVHQSLINPVCSAVRSASLFSPWSKDELVAVSLAVEIGSKVRCGLLPRNSRWDSK